MTESDGCLYMAETTKKTVEEQALIPERNDPTGHLVYADWLEERGRDAEATAMRAEAEAIPKRLIEQRFKDGIEGDFSGEVRLQYAAWLDGQDRRTEAAEQRRLSRVRTCLLRQQFSPSARADAQELNYFEQRFRRHVANYVASLDAGRTFTIEFFPMRRRPAMYAGTSAEIEYGARICVLLDVQANDGEQVWDIPRIEPWVGIGRREWLRR